MNKKWISFRNLMGLLIILLITMAIPGCPRFGFYPSLQTSPGRAETNKLEYTDRISGFSFVNLPDDQGGTSDHIVFIGERNDYLFDKLYEASLFKSPELNLRSMKITNVQFFSVDVGKPAERFEGYFNISYYFDDAAMKSPNGKVIESAKGIEQKTIEEKYHSTCLFSPCNISISDVTGRIYGKNILKFDSNIFPFKETFQMDFFNGYELKKGVNSQRHGFSR